ncbi:MAG: UvrD-helicase domain-containing protein [Treponema sp.]|jgi:ATP-dependent helicase/nuclease subunit A|nr:UvrD-helicase domain-containing protein [Treponema sp.]
MQLNEEQKEAAFCSENAIVAAGAGSGKTLVLANRFIWLLTEKGFKVNEILTLTFTRKAAAQMYRRIYSLVSELMEQETGIKAERLRLALDNFIYARIQTLDSYSSSIVKQCASRYGISPDFQIDNERCYNLALEVSYPFFIENRHHPAVEKLYINHRPGDIVHNIFANTLFNYSYIDKPNDFLADVKTQFDILCGEWNNLSKELITLLKETESLIYENNALLPELIPLIDQFSKHTIRIPITSSIREYFNFLLSLPHNDCVEKALSHPIQVTLTKLLFYLDKFNAHNLSLQKGKKFSNPVKDNIKKIRLLFNPLSSLIISCMQGGFNVSVMSLLSKLQKRYLSKKRAQGILTFKDVASLSRTILLEQKDIRQSEKETFKAIMIDEFQDNNKLQKDILFLLAENLNITNNSIPPPKDLTAGKLFFVGDEKQSIYLFRDADVSVFRRLKQEIKSRDLPLSINYRSAPGLIKSFNAIFPYVFAPPSFLPPYEALYTPLQAGGGSGSGNLSVCILNKKSQIEDEETMLCADETEARFVAEKIKKLLSANYQPQDIAILFRSRKSQYLYEKHLRAFGIPYTCEEINDLFYGGPVNDIMSVLRLTAHPMDKASYAQMLRSPFVGLSLHGITVCLIESSAPFDDKCLHLLDETDKTKYCLGQKIYSNICQMAKSESISSLVSELWYNQGYRYETEWNPQVNVYRQFYDYLFHLAALADAKNQGLTSFTDSMISFRDSGGQLTDIQIPHERPGAVHLMTIHKSKGLEFPVVFICGCGKRSLSDFCDIVYLSGTAGFVFSPPPPEKCRSIFGKRSNFFWEQANEETKRKRVAELRRLLYVGMTRAEKELYITGSLDINDTDGIDNFSILVKNHVENKYKNKDNYIKDDIIYSNDTLFGLLLPAITRYISGDKKESEFFNLEEIPFVPENANIKNSQIGLEEFLQKTKPFYERAQVIKTPVIYDNHVTPVSLYKSEDSVSSYGGWSALLSKEHSGESSSDIFKKVDSKLSHFLKAQGSGEKFNYGSFGTLAHICVEAHLNKEQPVIPSNISGLLNSSQLSAMLRAGNELAKRFVASPLGKLAEVTKLREHEFSFRSLIKNREGKEIFINGTIDLFFEDNEFIHIVDFKTDKIEKPWEYIAQMSCYYNAISALYAIAQKKQCRTWLFYLRTGHAVEITEKVKQFNLEQRVFL